MRLCLNVLSAFCFLPSCYCLSQYGLNLGEQENPPSSPLCTTCLSSCWHRLSVGSDETEIEVLGAKFAGEGQEPTTYSTLLCHLVSPHPLLLDSRSCFCFLISKQKVYNYHKPKDRSLAMTPCFSKQSVAQCVMLEQLRFRTDRKTSVYTHSTMN